MKFNKITMKTWVRILVFHLLVLGLIFPGAVPAGEAKIRVITDMANRRVIIKDPVEKIVTTFKPASLCVLSLGLQHKLVGIDSSSKRDRLQRAVFPGVVKLAGVGSKSMGINFETLVSLKPDLVILYSQKDGIELADRLESMKIPSIVIIPETFESINESMRMIATATGEPGKIKIVENQIDTMLRFVAQRLEGLTNQERKTGYFASTRGLFSTATGNMLQDEIFTRAGVKNVSHHLTGYFQDISPEQLVKWNPDIMVLSQHMKISEARRLSNKALGQITAVSTQNVFRCPSNLSPWDFPSPLSALATLWLAKKAYPDRFSDIDIYKKADEFHEQVFGKTLTKMNGALKDAVEF